MVNLNGTKRAVYLWELDSGDYKEAEKHKKFEGVYLCPVSIDCCITIINYKTEYVMVIGLCGVQFRE